jgi:hypothetical protein
MLAFDQLEIQVVAVKVVVASRAAGFYCFAP